MIVEKRFYNDYIKALINAVKSEDIKELEKVIIDYKELFYNDFINEFRLASDEVKLLTLYKIMIMLNISKEYNDKAKEYILNFEKENKGGEA